MSRTHWRTRKGGKTRLTYSRHKHNSINKIGLLHIYRGRRDHLEVNTSVSQNAKKCPRMLMRWTRLANASAKRRPKTAFTTDIVNINVV